MNVKDNLTNRGFMLIGESNCKNSLPSQSAMTDLAVDVKAICVEDCCLWAAQSGPNSYWPCLVHAGPSSNRSTTATR